MTDCSNKDTVASSNPCAKWKIQRNVTFHLENGVNPIVLYADKL